MQRTATCRAYARPIGAEPVDPDAVQAFVAAAARFGFPPGGIFPAFGMAEVGIAGSFPPRDRGMVGDASTAPSWNATTSPSPSTSMIPTSALHARRLPLLGPPVPGLEIRVADPETDEAAPERHVGELVIRGPR